MNLWYKNHWCGRTAKLRDTLECLIISDRIIQYADENNQYGISGYNAKFHVQPISMFRCEFFLDVPFPPLEIVA